MSIAHAWWRSAHALRPCSAAAHRFLLLSPLSSSLCARSLPPFYIRFLAFPRALSLFLYTAHPTPPLLPPPSLSNISPPSFCFSRPPCPPLSHPRYTFRHSPAHPATTGPIFQSFENPTAKKQRRASVSPQKSTFEKISSTATYLTTRRCVYMYGKSYSKVANGTTHTHTHTHTLHSSQSNQLQKSVQGVWYLVYNIRHILNYVPPGTHRRTPGG